MANETSLLLWWTSLVTLWIFNPTTSRQTSNNMPCCWSLRLVVLSHVWLWVGQPIRLLRTCEVSVQSGWGFTLYSGNTHWQTHTRSAAHSFRPTLNSSEFRSVGLLGLFWCDWVSHCKLALGQKREVQLHAGPNSHMWSSPHSSVHRRPFRSVCMLLWRLRLIQHSQAISLN